MHPIKRKPHGGVSAPVKGTAPGESWLHSRTRLLLVRTGQYFLAVLLAVYSAFPIYYMVICSFRQPQVFYTSRSLLPVSPTLEYYRTLIQRTDFPLQFWNSIIVATATVVVTLVVSIMMAYAVSRFKVRGKKVVIATMLYAYMFPPLLLAIPLTSIFAAFNLIDRLPSLVVAHFTMTLPLAVWFLWGFLKAMPFELEEAAMVDGCSRLSAFVRVILPLSLPGLTTVAIFSFLLSWTDYTFGLVLLSSDSNKTLPVGLASLLGGVDMRWGEMMAGATLIVIPLFVLFAFFSRYFVAGMSAGAVKG
jgi:multiple sugar transport system permease protein